MKHEEMSNTIYMSPTAVNFGNGRNRAASHGNPVGSITEMLCPSE